MRNSHSVIGVGLVATFLICNPAQAGQSGFRLTESASSGLSTTPSVKPAFQKSSATTDVSDLWWNPNESGWGMQLVQNNNFVFATLFIYGANGAPTWLSAEMNNVGGFTWSGPLYATTGPWFAAPSFDPGLVGVQQVGTMTFQVTDIADGVVTYTVNGTTITKNVTRETLVNEDLSGVYDEVRTQTQTCVPPFVSGTGPSLRALSISQSGTTVVGQSSDPLATCYETGTYSQNGKLGAISGTFSCTDGEVGTFQLFEIEVTETGMVGRLASQSNFCTISGQFAANRR